MQFFITIRALKEPSKFPFLYTVEPEFPCFYFRRKIFPKPTHLGPCSIKGAIKLRILPTFIFLIDSVVPIFISSERNVQGSLNLFPRLYAPHTNFVTLRTIKVAIHFCLAIFLWALWSLFLGRNIFSRPTQLGPWNTPEARFMNHSWGWRVKWS